MTRLQVAQKWSGVRSRGATLAERTVGEFDCEESQVPEVGLESCNIQSYLLVYRAKLTKKTTILTLRIARFCRTPARP